MNYTVKITFQGASRDVQLAAPVTMTDLKAAVASTFEFSDGTSGDQLLFTYHDSEGDDITIRLDSELALALRLSKGSLDIRASLVDGDQQIREIKHQHAHNVHELYETAAAELRTSHGIPSMTADKLRRIIALLQLHPRRLVARGLAPRCLLTHKPVGSAMLDNTNDTMDHGSDRHEDKRSKQQEATAAHGVGGDPIHLAFVSRGVALEPHETGPLLAALGMGPRRLVGLGLVDRRVFRAHLCRSHSGGQQHEAGDCSRDVGDIYEAAAGTLRASHGVSSITGVDLRRTMVLLELPAKRLVFQGLVSRDLLRGESPAVVGESGGEQATGADAEGVVEEEVTHEKEGDGDKGPVHAGTDAEGAAAGAAAGSVEVAATEGKEGADEKGPVHAMFVSRGIASVSASEIRPLLRALGVRPQRLVRLGLVRREMVRPEGAGMCGGGRGGPGWGRGGGRGRARGRGRGMGMGRGDRSTRQGHGMPRCAVPSWRVGVVGEA